MYDISNCMGWTIELMSFIRSYVVPEGFPDSVTPSYVPYMSWRALKHFFGGAMGVFTTQTLLNSVGVSRNRSAPGAVAINWILKDGAGRVGKMLFARQGKKFDYDLKQLATAAVPHLFLPLACAANVAKNVAAVTSTSTRTPIYKAFAKGENIGDVTAKGECVGNIADLVCLLNFQSPKMICIYQGYEYGLGCLESKMTYDMLLEPEIVLTPELGTGLSIMISKRNPSLVTTFALLSCGYVLSSYQEVKSVVLHTLNRARFSVAIDSFLRQVRMRGNMKENIFSFPWLEDKPIVLGSRFKDAFQDAGSYLSIEPLFEKERYLVTYNPSKDGFNFCNRRICFCILLFHQMGVNLFLRSSRTMILHILCPQLLILQLILRNHVKWSSTSYGLFKSKAAEQGWTMSESLLNPGRARLVLTG
ncbi:Protein root UVB sensitive 6 [Vitis vinifera]|uniref:Protein root UVB sensitive 6 n=1 Tax=Vitis vinifera TaxID=29760 RepID=A0A438E9I0_VITVI|nr:Protein root UVB sensitive 6 [Vitis vinifera]